MAFQRTVRQSVQGSRSKGKSVSSAVRGVLEPLESRLLLSVSHTPDFSGDLSDLSPGPAQTGTAFDPAGPLPRLTGATGTPPNAIQLTDGMNSEVSAFWANTQQGVDTFDTTFDFSYGTHAPGADGMAFVLQNGGGPNITGGGGGTLGFGGIHNSVAIKFDIYPGVSTTGLYLNGAQATDNPVQAPSSSPIGSGISVDLTAGGVDFHANPTDAYRCHLVYDGTTLTETVSDVTKNRSITQAYTVSIPGAVGDHVAYAGFTAATGGVNSEQDIVSWTYTGTGTSGSGPIVLPAPTLIGQDSLPTQGQLIWDNPSNNTQGYEIDDSTDNGATYNLFETTFPNPQMPVVVIGLDPNTTYLFKVKSFGDGATFLDSPFSNVVTIHGGGVQTQPVVHSPNFADVNDLKLNGGAHFTGAGIVAPPVTDPTTAPTLGQSAGTGLAPGTYYVVYSWNSSTTYPWDANAGTHGRTASSPEASITLTAGNGILQVTPPAAPANAGAAMVYVGTASGAERLVGPVGGGQTLNVTAVPGAGAHAAPTSSSIFSTPPNALLLTSSDNNQAGSVFTKGLQLVTHFDTSFDFVFHSDNTTTADGMTFLIQDNQPTALGSTGGGLGYSSIGHSVAVKFDLWDGRAGVPTTQTSTVGVYTNSNLNDDLATGAGQLNEGYDVSTGGINFHSGSSSDVLRAHLAYDGTTLHLTLTDLNNPTASFTQDFPIDIPTTIGSPYAYVGFTGATGGEHAEQDVLQWTMPTAIAASQTITGTSGNDTITLRKNADGTHDDVWINVPTTGPATEQVSAGQSIVINGAGGTDTLVLDSTNGNPIPTGTNSVVRLNGGTGTFALGGTLPTLDASHVVDLGTSTLSIPYTGSSPLATIRGALKNGFLKSTDAAGSSGKFAVADVDANSKVTLSYRVVGDLDGNGTVAFADLLALAQHYNQTGVDWSKGDLNYDGTVGFGDLLALAQHYNQTASSAAASTDSMDILAAARKRSRK